MLGRALFQVLFVMVVVLSLSTARGVDIEYVPVGNPGNKGDGTGCGSVGYPYMIGKYEVTNAQWRDFLNTKASVSDPYGLYDANMPGIDRTWTMDHYVYTPKGGDTNWDNRPVTWVGFWDVARFCNWLHNGQGNSDTETGAYLNIGDQDSFTRQPDAKYFIPTENEWHKAAYYDPQKAGGPGYWAYPTRSNSPPINTLVTPDPGNHANFYDAYGTGNGFYTIGNPYEITLVGDFENSASAYGTFDQGGNVGEWTENAVGPARRLRGGDWGRSVDNLHSSYRDSAVATWDGDHQVGFRVASIPEPNTITLLLCGLVGALLWCRPKRVLPIFIVFLILAVLASTPLAVADTFGTGENQFTLDFVPISSSTNPTVEQTTAGDLDGFGIVGYDYRMGVYEITNSQWDKFVAELGVPVTGSPSNAYDFNFYDWGTGTIDVPTNEVSWYEVAQFINWLNTSTGHQPAYKFNGTQGQSDYTFDTWDASEAWGGTNLYRHKDAFYFLPTEDEWFKAAYWNGTEIQDYATKPGDTLHQGDGESGTGWNYFDKEYSTVSTGPWDVGSGSEELNGTYDMMGNNWEWLESPWDDPNYGASSSRGVLGGDWILAPYFFHAATRNGSDGSGLYPSYYSSDLGFRVVSIPEPGSITLILCGVIASLICWRRWK